MNRRYFNIFASLLLLTSLAACSGNIVGPSGGTSPVTITIGSPAKSAGINRATAIPPGVSKIIFTVSGKDMGTITREVIVSGQASVTETFDVLNGDERRFKVEAADSSGQPLFKGEQTGVKLDGTPVTIDITMQAI